MNSSSDPERDAEAARVGRTYGSYRRSRRRRRAWAADNPGNRAMREELLPVYADRRWRQGSKSIESTYGRGVVATRGVLDLGGPCGRSL